MVRIIESASYNFGGGAHHHREHIMWEELRPGLVLVPEKVGGLLSGFAKQLQDVILTFCPTSKRKARRKDKEASAPGEDPKLYLEEAVLERKHGDLDLRTLVELPAGLDYNEWLASHTIAFFDHINLIYGTISEFCTMSGCPDMTGPGLRTYLWFDEKGKKTKVAAPQYIDYVMTFTQKTINDESIFPTKYANEFPSSFESLVKKILRLLFHVVAHMYHSHFKEIMLLKLHSELNSVFTHIILFNERFHLIEEKETEILQDLATALRVHSEPPELAAPPQRPAKDNNNCVDSEGGARDVSGAAPAHPQHHRHESQGGPPPAGPAIPASG
ncbi:MOB kinase activator-like 2 isoform X2 [Neocloeon triangulifer]|uniref:MOB kinase activator-like 2 isoform X2 n=1 Tax=Neocloeon triangulifer TaxID=2078957 RepID=UPI00286F5771|nr:MOB kinase activator-like 2 isoform X2 [Neocloeon triangulifer]